MEGGGPRAAATSHAVRRSTAVLMVVAVLAVAGLAAGLRIATLRADLPYTTYIDEHFPLKGAAQQISDRSWDPHFYGYPSFLMDSASIGAAGLALARGETGALTAGARATVASRYIEVVEPGTLVLAGRIVVLLLSVATVILVALLGTRLAGRRVGVLSAVVVAVLPIFVTRGAIVIVDTPATCFAVAALYCAARIEAAARTRQLATWVALGGVASALAFTSKYTIGTVLLAVLAVVALARHRSVATRLKLGLTAIGCFALTSVIVMPALVVRTGDVIRAVRGQENVYSSRAGTDSYLHQLVGTREVGVAVLVAALIGLFLLLRSRRARSSVIAYLVFAVPTVVVLVRPAFQPVRNVMPLVPFLAIAAVTAVVEGVGYVLGLASRPLPRWLPAGVATLVVVATVWVPFQDGTRAYISDKRGHVDTRRELRDWISTRVRPGDHVLVSEELAFLPSELRSLCAHVVVQSQQSAVTMHDDDWVVLGDLNGPKWPAAWRGQLATRRSVRTVGAYPTSGAPGNTTISPLLEDVWHGNDERIHVYGPVHAVRRVPRDGGCARRDHSFRAVSPLVLEPGHASTTEPAGGTTELRIPFRLSRPSVAPVVIAWRTLPPGPGVRLCDETDATHETVPARAGVDYSAGNGTVTLAPGHTRGSVGISVLGHPAAPRDACVLVSFGSATPGVRLGGVYGLGVGLIRQK